MIDTGGPSSAFYGTPTCSYLVNNYGVRNEALGYNTVYATAAAGNSDIAYLTGGCGNNTFHGTAGRSSLTGNGFSYSSHRFRSGSCQCGSGQQQRLLDRTSRQQHLPRDTQQKLAR